MPYKFNGEEFFEHNGSIKCLPEHIQARLSSKKEKLSYFHDNSEKEKTIFLPLALSPDSLISKKIDIFGQNPDFKSHNKRR